MPKPELELFPTNAITTSILFVVLTARLLVSGVTRYWEARDSYSMGVEYWTVVPELSVPVRGPG